MCIYKCKWFPQISKQPSNKYSQRFFDFIRTMGAGGRMNESETKRDVFKHVPVEKPPFGIADVKKAIPPHCFNRSLSTSFYYLIRDLCFVFSLYYIANNYITLLSPPFSYIAWPIYWFSQGSVMVGLWNIVHDCGHHSFSEYPLIDNTIGLIFHSLVLTPYFSFKYSHRTHHANTSSLEKDENWVPKLKNDTWFVELIANPIVNVFLVLFRLVFGYFGYFLFNLHGRIYKGFPSHFNPLGPIFNDSERAQVFLSDIGVGVVAYGLYRIGTKTGFQWLLYMYGYPLLVMCALFILFTYLNHNHPSVAHYDAREWDWLRGALATVDRDYGILNTVFHDEPNAHVVHHLFSSIPHYHIVEATRAVKPVLGEYYNFDDTPIVKAVFRETYNCLFIKEDPEKEGVYWFSK
ncbi:putative fatty acid desaturase domain-containing protein [Helianthus annuus]|uniref:Fatty acid desaturase domain-containing protein n=1 Tax=Helianthus annuus TaxID=4232 RepID=A0A251T2J6_HELAN|nr:delta(12)-fatty-acid desaturase FAD2 [Helianthus annuus]KAF5777624.1 putative fatty acid desaturase domain-containing protein [Helianthus annuus]KAJ0489136.1 putative fatty acid desaturase domain-containing protein [Helianthus annuus]KAJ0492834.1 putative fatty acid desaturase domain-containing protein [Helianthus annuus]KAJ0505014.1 putative fatty acid desaturase domain-containing protein [Helianthus annuus]KAJ0674698.1 putative fatty acid desaturase domain-containing protein [Helianthus a